MKMHNIPFNDELPKELVYYSVYDTAGLDGKKEIYIDFKVRVYTELRLVSKLSDASINEHLNFFAREFERNIKTLKGIASLPTFNFQTSEQAYTRIFKLLPNHLGLRIRADDGFKKFFILVPYEKAIPNIPAVSNYIVELETGDIQGTRITEEFIDKMERNECILNINYNQVSLISKNEMILKLEKRAKNHENFSFYTSFNKKYKSLFDE